MRRKYKDRWNAKTCHSKATEYPFIGAFSVQGRLYNMLDKILTRDMSHF